MQNSRPSLILLSVICALSPFGVTVIVPILPILDRSFDVSLQSLQFGVSAYVLGLAAMQPISGYLADTIGRRRVLLSGFLVFIGASICLALASEFWLIIVLRFVQAAGVSVGTVVARAVARDVLDEKQVLRAFSAISAAMGVSPIFAPIVGGWMGEALGYQGVFLITAAVGLAIWVWAWLKIPETRPISYVLSDPVSPVESYRRLLFSAGFLGYTGVYGFLQCTFFSFLGVGAVAFSDLFGMSESRFGTIWGLMALTYLLGAFCVNGLVERVGLYRAMHGLSLFLFFSGWMGLALQLWLGLSVFSLLLQLALLMTAAGAMTPTALAGVVNLFPEVSGTAAGLSSSIGLTLAGLSSMLGGLLYSLGGYYWLSVLIASCGTLAAVSWFFAHLGQLSAENSS